MYTKMGCSIVFENLLKWGKCCQTLRKFRLELWHLKEMKKVNQKFI